MEKNLFFEAILDKLGQFEDLELDIKDIMNMKLRDIPTRVLVKEWAPACCPFCNKELSESMGDGYYKHYTNLNICDCGQKLKW